MDQGKRWECDRRVSPPREVDVFRDGRQGLSMVWCLSMEFETVDEDVDMGAGSGLGRGVRWKAEDGAEK